MESIGQRIKKRRTELNLTQTQIRDLTGISSGNMSDYEHGKMLPSATALIALSSALKCSTDWILKGNSLISDNNVLATEEKELLNSFRLLNSNDKEEILLLIQLKTKRLKGEKSLGSTVTNKYLA